jgi:uncharacterized membrane protein
MDITIIIHPFHGVILSVIGIVVIAFQYSIIKGRGSK